MTNMAMFGVSCAAIGAGVSASYGYVKDKVNSGVNKIVPKSWEDSYTSNAVSHIITATLFIGGAYFLVNHLPSFRELAKDSSTSGTGSPYVSGSPEDVAGALKYGYNALNQQKGDSFFDLVSGVLSGGDITLVTKGGGEGQGPLTIELFGAASGLLETTEH